MKQQYDHQATGNAVFVHESISHRTNVKELHNAAVVKNLHYLHSQHNKSMAAIIAHLSELDRRKLYIELGYTSTFAYLQKACNLSEGQACLRITAARLLPHVPELCDYLAAGKLHISGIHVLAPLLHKTQDTKQQQVLLEAACYLSKREIQALVARLSPQASVPASIRKLPKRQETRLRCEQGDEEQEQEQEQEQGPGRQPLVIHDRGPNVEVGVSRRGSIEPLSSATYKVVFTADSECKVYLEKARQLTMITKERGKLELIMKAALQEFVHKLEKRKYGLVLSDTLQAAVGTSTGADDVGGAGIGTGTDDVGGVGRTDGVCDVDDVDDAIDGCNVQQDDGKVIQEVGVERNGAVAGRGKSVDAKKRYIPAAIRRAVVARDGGRCTYIKSNGQRCRSRYLLEFHHRVPFAKVQEHSVENITLHCSVHNKYQAQVDFGEGAKR